MSSNQAERTVSIDPDLKDLFEGYLSKRLAEFSQIDSLVDAGKFRDIEFITHKFAGNAGSFELADLGEKSLVIEKAARNKDADLVKKLSLELFEALKRVRIAT